MANRRSCVLVCVVFSSILTVGLIATGISLFFFLYTPQPQSSSPVEVGGDVPVLLNRSGIPSFWYDGINITLAESCDENVTVFHGQCQQLHNESTIFPLPLKEKEVTVSSANTSFVPLNYYNHDRPVYSAGDPSTLTYRISAHIAGKNATGAGCPLMVYLFANYQAYCNFPESRNGYVDRSECLTVGEENSSKSDFVFALRKPSFYFVGAEVGVGISLNTSIYGVLVHYDPHDFHSVNCSESNCTINPISHQLDINERICILIQSSLYCTVEFNLLKSESQQMIAILLLIVPALCVTLLSLSAIILVVAYHIRKNACEQKAFDVNLSSTYRNPSCRDNPEDHEYDSDHVEQPFNGSHPGIQCYGAAGPTYSCVPPTSSSQYILPEETSSSFEIKPGVPIQITADYISSCAQFDHTHSSPLKPLLMNSTNPEEGTIEPSVYSLSSGYSTSPTTLLHQDSQQEVLHQTHATEAAQPSLKLDKSSFTEHGGPKQSQAIQVRQYHKPKAVVSQENISSSSSSEKIPFAQTPESTDAAVVHQASRLKSYGATDCRLPSLNQQKQTSASPIRTGSADRFDPIAMGIFETVVNFDFDENGLKYHSADHGVTVIIPRDAVASKTRFVMGISLVGPFHFPGNCRPVSAIVWIDISSSLTKKAELHIPHFIKLQSSEEAKRLSVFTATDESYQSNGEFLFEEVASETSFLPGSSYGTLWIDHFSAIALVEEVKRSALPKEYLLSVVKPINCNAKRWETIILLSYELLTCQKIIKDQYPENKYCLKYKPVVLTEESATLTYEKSPAPGWRIELSSLQTEITKEDIDFWNICPNDKTRLIEILQCRINMKTYPPSISVAIVQLDCDKLNDLSTEITVNGVHPCKPFLIYAYPLVTNGTQAVPHQTPKPNPKPPDSEPMLAGADPFLSKVILSLQDILHGEWYTFGLHIGLDAITLNGLSEYQYYGNGYKTCIRKMLTTWRSKFDDEATWEVIIGALRKIQFNREANQLEQRYMTRQDVQTPREQSPVEVPATDSDNNDVYKTASEISEPE